MRVRRMAATLAAGATVVALAACNNDGGQGGGEGGGQDFLTSLTFGTGGASGTYYPLGTEYANIFEENIQGVTVNAIETGASVENLGQIYQGEMQLGLTQNDTAISAVAGTGDFQGAAVDNVGWIGKLYPEAAHIITLADSGYESVADLEGERIAVGPPGSGTRAVAEAILSAYGIEAGEYEPFEEEFGDAQGLLQDGNLDASIFVIGTPSSALNELAATNDVRLLPVEPDIAEEIAADTNFATYTLAAGTYDFLEEDVTTLSVFAALVASTTQVSPELGYDLTRAVYENAGDITLPQSDLITVEEALVGQGDIPLHPGAEQYYEEQGVL
ncbi:TAXI family TRAP transporter solute-binding subunit [Georgenia alba]|uniref:TAXI family TRAP transporter solute-binding subunit n=1 Tax=Georgenia alba TaxID=2233858 RepID=A0ABW2Q964_9MICO